MNRIIFTLLLAFSAAACANKPSPYSTSCDLTACRQIALTANIKSGESGAFRVISDPGLTWLLPSSPIKMANQGSMLALFFEDGSRLAATTLSLDDFGIPPSQTKMHSFLKAVFLTPFNDLEVEATNVETLHAIRSLKLQAFKQHQPQLITKGDLSIYFYRVGNTEQLKAYATSSKLGEAALLDFYGFSLEEAKQVIASISLLN